MALRSIFDDDFQKETEKETGENEISPNGVFRIKIKPEGAGNSYIELRFSYPPTYPSHGPPGLAVSSESWLTPYAIKLVQQSLEKLLKENEGQVVVYTLATWILEESWAYLMSRSSYSNPIVIHFSPLPKKATRSVRDGLKVSAHGVNTPVSLSDSINYQHGHPLTITEGKSKINVVPFYARIRSVAHVQQVIREIKDKQKEKPTSPKLQGTTEHYLAAYRFAATDRSPVHEGSDEDQAGAGGGSDAILRLLQRLNLYDIAVVVRLRWTSAPGGDVYKKMLSSILAMLKDGSVVDKGRDQLLDGVG